MRLSPAQRSVVRRRRRTAPAAVTAVLLLAAALTVGWSAVTLVAGYGLPTVVSNARSWLAYLTWASPWVLVAGVVLLLLGLLWIVLGIKPGPLSAVPVQVPARPEVRDAATVFTRRSMARLASVTAQAIDGVDHVASTVGRRLVRIDVDTTLTTAEPLARTVEEAVRTRFGACGVQPLPVVRCRVRRREA